MPTVTEYEERFGPDGALLSRSAPVVRDVTAETNVRTIATRARAWLGRAATHLTTMATWRTNATLGQFRTRSTSITTNTSSLQAEAVANRAATQAVINLLLDLSAQADDNTKAVRELVLLLPELRDLLGGELPA